MTTPTTDKFSFPDAGPLPPGLFDVILMDPPWEYYGSTEKWGAAGKFYPLMADASIHALPVAESLSKNGIVFAWATSSTLERALACFRAWELHFRGIAWVWVKTSKAGVPFGARGVRPSITKPLTELVLCASRVAKGRPLKLHDESITQTIFAPLGAHSEKPLNVHDALERMYPDATKLEMFARAARPGWEVWGNQAPAVSP
jgi:N6-adenosine-specific RNA methylase IME4